VTGSEREREATHIGDVLAHGESAIHAHAGQRLEREFS
jgi:hypothetical protein